MTEDSDEMYDFSDEQDEYYEYSEDEYLAEDETSDSYIYDTISVTIIFIIHFYTPKKALIKCNSLVTHDFENLS